MFGCNQVRPSVCFRTLQGSEDWSFLGMCSELSGRVCLRCEGFRSRLCRIYRDRWSVTESAPPVSYGEMGILFFCFAVKSTDKQASFGVEATGSNQRNGSTESWEVGLGVVGVWY